MKKVLFIVFVLSAMLFVVSCAGEDEIANALGGSCSPEGVEACSQDSSQILICQDASWQTKKTCNLNFGQYCRQNANGSFSCTDSENSSNTTEPGDNDNNNNNNDSDPTDDPNSNDTDPEQPDNEPVDDNNTSDNEPVDNEQNDNDADNEPHDTSTIESCEGIIKCQDQCTDGDCINDCYNRGNTEAQNEFYERNHMCPGYTELDDLKHCQELAVKCGVKGDSSFNLPYGHAVIFGDFEYVYTGAEGETLGDGIYIDGSFISGYFGNSGNIVDPTAGETGTYAFTLLNEYTETHVEFLNIIQAYKDDTKTQNPLVSVFITATAPGTYSVGMDDEVKILIRNWDYNSKKYTCDHAFGYGYVELSGTALAETYTTGEKTLSIKGEINLYSYKNAPMYKGQTSKTGDITNANLVACPLN